jgi:acyl dehydratase
MRKDFGREQYFEDFAVGDEFRTEPVPFEEDDIVAFARQFDPQVFHIDPAAARETIYGGLIASGWHVLSATFRALIDAGFLRSGGMGSPGLDEVRWIKPVRPGDRIEVRLEVLGTRPSGSRADRGYVDLAVSGVNQKDETVMSYRVREILRRRSAQG